MACTVTKMPVAGWDLAEIFCDGSGKCTTDLSQGRVTITLTSSEDFVYCRFTNRRTQQPVDEAGPLGPCVPALALVGAVMAGPR